MVASPRDSVRLLQPTLRHVLPSLWFFVALVLGGMAGESAHASVGVFNAQGFLRQMPTSAEIEAAYPLGGKDPVDAAARRAAAYKLVGVVIAESNGRDGSPAGLDPVESAAYRQYSDEGPLGVRAAMGWPRVGSGGNKEVERYDRLVTDYVWMDKRRADVFALEFKERLFAGKEHLLPEDMRLTRAQERTLSVAALATFVLGLLLGFVAVRPWRFAREGEVSSLGSGLTQTNPGLFRLAYNQRNHLTIAGKRLGTTVTSPTVDDAIAAALELGAPVRLGIGATLWRHWVLGVKSPAGAVREPLFSFCLQTFVITPIVFLVAVFVAALLGPLTGSGYVALFAITFVAAYGCGYVVRNVLAWLA